jgi:GTP1/Obg family GTP-binding protein
MRIKDNKKSTILSIREKETINRFEMVKKCSGLLTEFFKMGFKSFPALKAIMQFYYPDIDLLKLKRVWSCVLMDQEIVDKIVTVFDKLKSE